MPSTYHALDMAFALEPAAIRVLLLTDACPPPPEVHYVYADPASLSWQNTQLILAGAGVAVQIFQDVLDRGILLATCLDGVRPEPVTAVHLDAGARWLEGLVAPLTGLRAVGLMGDVAIGCFNRMHRRLTGRILIPAGSTYKLRAREYWWGSVRVFPSYLHTGRNFLIEKAKQRMVADDMRRIAGFL